MDHSSPSGMYDQAVEASAQKLMFASWVSSNQTLETLTPSNNSSSGYASDADTLESQETSSGDIASYTSSSSLTNESSEEEETIESEIAFLQKKQSLLQMAMTAMKREEVYDATKAVDVVNGNLPAEADIWKEAREVLDVLKSNGDISMDVTRKFDDPPVAVQNRKRPQKRPRIDVSSVLCHSATDEDNHPIASRFGRIIPNKNVLCAGHWVAKAMEQSFKSPPSSTTVPSVNPSSTNSTWEIMNDPDLGPLVVPPPKLQLKMEVTLKDALSFTGSAQIITLSTPPFFIVHANKAFSIFSGLQNGDVVGKPVDTVINVQNDVSLHQRQQFTTTGLSQPSFASSGAAPSSSSSSAFQASVFGSGKPCQVRLTTISDHRRWISHLLIKVEQCSDGDLEQEQPESMSFDLVALVPKETAAATATSRTASRHRRHLHSRGSHHHGYGTVG